MSVLPPYYGGKLLAGRIIWERFGRVKTYSEPFCGVIGAARACPYVPAYEVFCDLDGMITNALRALKWAPDAVARHADWPISARDMAARHAVLCERRAALEAELKDPEYYDAQLAGWWLWGASCHIGPGFAVPDVACTGVNLSHRRGAVAAAANGSLLAECRKLSARLRNAIIVCDDWREAVKPDALGFHAAGRLPAAVLLDPVYPGFDGMYVKSGRQVHREAAEWAIENGDNPQLRIALCGYEGDVSMPVSWECVPWKSKGKSNNASRERIWFSPYCVRREQLSLI